MGKETKKGKIIFITALVCIALCIPIGIILGRKLLGKNESNKTNNNVVNKQNIIDKYFEKEKNEILKKWAKNPSEIKKTYIALKQQKIEKEAIDKKIIIDNFLNGTLNTKNYTKEKFKSNCLKILPQKIYAKINKDEDIYINISKFLNSLYEYKNFENFKFIITNIKNMVI